MRLEDCITDIAALGVPPLEKSMPEDCWIEARDSGAIPSPVYDLYVKANYLSLDASPTFLADSDRVLFTYFRMLLSSLRSAMIESADELAEFLTADASKWSGGTWDLKAEEKARRHFKHCLVALQASLDILADLIALFFPGRVKNLRVGRAQFSYIETWLESATLRNNGIVTPHEHFLQQLHDVLKPIVLPDSAEREWIRLMRLFRNKAAHLGTGMFRYVLLRQRGGPLYTFLPRQWPYIWERHIVSVGRDATPRAEPFQEILVHQDVQSFMEGLRAKVNDVIASGTAVLITAYDQLKDCPVDTKALSELESSTEKCGFEHFTNAVLFESQ